MDQEIIKRAAAAIANARGARRGAPAIKNIMDMLPEKLWKEVMEDAEAALKAAENTLPEPVTMGQVIDELELQTALDKNDLRIEDDYIIIHDHYEIPFSRIDNPIKLIWWIHHLCEKSWVKPRLINRLIMIATEKMGLKMYEGEG